MESKEKIYCPHCGGELNVGVLLGSRKSEKKAASSAENGKKGGRPRFSLQADAMKDGKMYVLMLVPMHVLGRGEKARYRFVVCHPGGGQTDAEHQPVNDGGLPDIQLLAEENGFEVLDIFDFAPKK